MQTDKNCVYFKSSHRLPAKVRYFQLHYVIANCEAVKQSGHKPRIASGFALAMTAATI
jgi:hypothetical protein